MAGLRRRFSQIVLIPSPRTCIPSPPYSRTYQRPQARLQCSRQTGRVRMGKILGNLSLALLLGVILLIVAMFGLHHGAMADGYIHWWLLFFHVISGVLWIGLLYY